MYRPSAIGHRPKGYFPAGSGYFSSTTNERGEYEINDLAPFDHAAERSKAEARAREIASDPKARPTPAPSIVFRHPKFALRNAPALKVPGQLDAQLKLGATIEGRAVDADGRPVAGALVQVYGSSMSEPKDLELYSDQTTTSADGNYRFESVPDCTYRIAGFAPELIGGEVEGKVGPGEMSKAPDLLFTPGATLRIQCVDSETGEPLNLQAAGQATVVLEVRTNGGGRKQVILQAKCSRDGKATVHAPGGEWRISVLVSTHKDRPWKPAARELEQLPKVTAVEGETVDVTVPMTQSQR